MKNYIFLIQSVLLIIGSTTLFASISEQRSGYLSDTNFIDGPHLFYNAAGITIKRIVAKKRRIKIEEQHIATNKIKDLSFTVAVSGMPNESFKVHLKPTLEVSPSTYVEPDKFLAISDLEGNFYAFQSLLKSRGIIDMDYQWTYGDGHLVLLGDFFDRGAQVTELLWLIYELESQAKLQGGQVHFILGNHEILNLNGMNHYADTKYLKIAKKMKIDYKELYGPSTELGRWLRTKNSIEKIGNDLFVHGGFSTELVESGLSIQEINENIRANLGLTYNEIYAKDKTTILIFGKKGPLWYRGNVDNYTESELKTVFQHFGGTAIILGHTSWRNEINRIADGQVITIDVLQPNEHSDTNRPRCLLKEEGYYYKVDDKDLRVRL